MPQAPTEERAEKFVAFLDSVLDKISTTEPIKNLGKASTVEALLAPKREQILDALKRGYKPGTIARIIKQADQLDQTWSKEAIRLAIVRISGRNPSAGKKRRASVKPAAHIASRPVPTQVQRPTNAFANAVRRP